MKERFPLAALVLVVVMIAASKASAQEIEININKRYLNIPVSHQQERAKMTFKVDGQPDLSVVIRLATDEPDYWVFKDVADLQGKTVSIAFEGDAAGLSRIYQADAIAGQDSLYQEKNRQQCHLSNRSSWINEANSLIYRNGEYHLYYQYDPYEREWENMHWGHAVSKVLIH